MDQGACNVYEKRKWDFSGDPGFLLLSLGPLAGETRRPALPLLTPSLSLLGERVASL